MSHYAKIDMSDGIYVVNIDGYIGESVSKEIEYAKQKGKGILLQVISAFRATKDSKFLLGLE